MLVIQHNMKCSHYDWKNTLSPNRCKAPIGMHNCEIMKPNSIYELSLITNYWNICISITAAAQLARNCYIMIALICAHSTDILWQRQEQTLSKQSENWRTMKRALFSVLLFCFVKEGLLSPTPTTTEYTTPPFTTPQMPGCEYGGNVYPPGADIPELRGKSGSWCYGAYCSQGFGSNSIIHWDDFNCGVKTSCKYRFY